MKNGQEDYYAALDISPTASQDEVKAAIRAQLRHWIRRSNNAPQSEDRRQAELRVTFLTRAQEALSDPESRAAYDRLRGGQGAPWSPPSSPTAVPPSQPIWQLPQPPSPPSQSYAPLPQPGAVASGAFRRWAGRHKKLVVISSIILAIWVISALGSLAGHLKGGGSSLTGAERRAILRPVLASLRSCSLSAELTPANCPQNVSASQSSGVVWKLYGNPVSGAQIEGGGSSYTVFGVATMTVSYVDYFGAQFSEQNVPYEAVVHSTGTTWHLSLMEAMQDTPPNPVVIPRPLVNGVQLRSIVRGAFRICVASRSPTPPPICPAQSSDQSGGYWTMQGNPLRNSAVTYDSSTGLLHVVGSYALEYHYYLYGPNTDPLSGTYDAQIADNNGHLVLLTMQSES